MEIGAVGPTLSESLLRSVQLEIIHSGHHRLEHWSHELCSPFWRLYSNRQEGGGIRSGGRTYWLDPGSVYLIPAWVGFTTLLARPVEHDYVHFAVHGLPLSLHRSIFVRPIKLPADSALLTVLQQWRGAICTPAVPALAVFGWTQALVALTLGRVLAELPPATVAEVERWLQFPARLQAALQSLEEEIADPPTNAKLARRCGLSEDHFIRVFRRQLGMTPSRYGLERRLAKAAQALATTDHKVEDIAAATGFSDRFHLTRMFRQHLGQPPVEYRRAHATALAPVWQECGQRV
jgi:AraC-like DNA-binding protein